MNRTSDRLLDWPTAKEAKGLPSRTTVWREVRAGRFPAPVATSPNRVAWRESDLDHWIATRPRAGIRTTS